MVSGHRVLPGTAAARQGSVLVQLQRRAARFAPAAEPEGLHGPVAGILRPFPERRAGAGLDAARDSISRRASKRGAGRGRRVRVAVACRAWMKSWPYTKTETGHKRRWPVPPGMYKIRQVFDRAIARALAGPLILLVIVVGFFWKLVLTDQYTWLESPDLAYQVVPWFQFEAEQFHQHHFPSWDPHLFAGQSLIGQAQPGLAYPLNWILFSLPLDHGHISFTALNWYYLLIHYLAALFCYFLCRDLGRSLIASIAAGVAFGLSGYVGATDWPQMINGAVWAPLVFLFLLRTTRGIRPLASAAFSGLFLGLSWLSGHHQIPIFLTLAAVATWLYSLFERGRVQRKLLAPIAIFLAFVVFTGALQMWPAYEYGRLALRWVGSPHDPIGWNQVVPYSVHQQFSLSPIYLLGILIPGYDQ